MICDLQNFSGIVYYLEQLHTHFLFYFQHLLVLGSADPIRMAGSINKGCGAGLLTCLFPRRDEVDEQSLV